jgi:hypothetical protein
MLDLKFKKIFYHSNYYEIKNMNKIKRYIHTEIKI